MTLHQEITADEVLVRIGTPEDIHPMMDAAMMATEENALCKPNPVKLLQDIWSALNMNAGIVGVIGAPGLEVEGFVLLRIGTLWYSDNLVAEEKCVFVRPEYRSAKGSRAKKLCEFSKACADNLGIPLQIGILSNIRTEAKTRLYKRMFGEPAGAYWLYNGHTGQR